MTQSMCYERDADGYLPIEAYGLIGNGRTTALVGIDGSIDWCPFSRIDEPSVFARILDADRGGYWQISPIEPWEVSRHYLDDTNVLVTKFSTNSGAVELLDLMPSFSFGSDLGLSQRLWDGIVLRFVRGVRGQVRMRQEFMPAFNYALEPASYEIIPQRGALACSTSGALRFICRTPLVVEQDRLVSEFDVRDGEGLYFAANFHSFGATVWADLHSDQAKDLLEREIDGWRRWIARCTYHGPYADHVRRSALVLKLLDYLPSGSMAAAATTSLPEHIGGVRNWDYRYAWIRDTTYAIHALHSIGYRDEAEGFLQWIIDVTKFDPSALQIMYRVDGESNLEEIELRHLEGYRKSRPVRIGNAAYQQRQLDRFGEVIDAAYVHRRFGGIVNDDLWGYIVAVVNVISQRWRHSDSGIWEVRSEPRRMTYSNVMCWVGVDRAIRIAERDHRDAPLKEWRELRERIRHDVMHLGVTGQGWFSQGLGDDILDAAALSFPLRNFIDVDHPVMRTTINEIDRRLTRDGLVRRYELEESRGDDNVDGLPGDEGRFLLCSFWLIDCLTGLGELERATALLEQMLGRANDLGLFSEEIDMETGMFLGNFPQAFSHLGVINSIINLAHARGDVQPEPERVTGEITGSIPPGPETRRMGKNEQ